MSYTNERMIPRERFMGLLKGLSGGQIVYICAPAGYGKTVAAGQWLEQSGRVGTVITLDERDNAPTRFCARFCGGLSLCQPENEALQKIISYPAFESAPEEFALRALDMLSDDMNACLIIDDLHFVHDENVLRMLLVFLKRLTESFQIILVSRNELPHGFSELWIKGALVRVTANDLRFSCEEVALLYKKHGNPITDLKADDIRRFTDGWAIGVGAVLMSGGGQLGDSLKYLDEFIEEKVWRLWDEPIREFMVKTSVAQELTPSLSDALTGEADSGKLLSTLVRQNMFITRTEQGVYRYHRLFYNFLRGRLSERPEAFSRNLLNKAGYWYLEQKDFYGAVECFLESGDIDGLSECYGLLVTAGHEYYFIEKLLPVADSFMRLGVVNKFPYIYSTLSWAAFNKGLAKEMALYADMYYANQDEIVKLDPRLTLNIILVRLVDFRTTLGGLMRAVGELKLAAAENDLDGMGVTLGTVNQNLPLLHRGTRDFSECAEGSVEDNIIGVKATLGGIFGDAAELLIECLHAGLLYEQGHLARAHVHAIRANAEIRKDTSPETKFFAMAILVYILDDLGQYDKANQALDDILEMIEREGAYYLNYNFSALTARRKLGNGDMNAARDWLKCHETVLSDNLNFYKLYGHFTTCRAYIVKGCYDDAILLLAKVLELAETYQRPLDVIEAQILLCIAYWKKKRDFRAEAIRYLEQAVSAACEYGYTQMFVNEGAELSGMLRRLQRRSEQRMGENPPPASFVKMLYLKTQECRKKGLTSGQANKPVKFTGRQKEVMKLLAEGKSYREISEELGVARPTLRSHIAAIYKKLDCANEADAVKEIIKLGIFPDND